ncbi:MAG: KH domain-containing protein [bacterium]|nr:KH domain-containing protein [bacterium]
MSSIDQQFVEYIVKSLVGKPDEVSIERRIDEKGVLLELTVDPEDLGRVIGKRGATAQSLRTLLRALGTKNDARYNLKIIDNGVEGRDKEGSGGGEGWSSKPAKSDDTPATLATASDDDAAADVILEEKTEDNSESIKKTRKELEDLDDLDI